MGLDLDLAFDSSVTYAGLGDSAEIPAARATDALLYNRLWLNRHRGLFDAIKGVVEGTVPAVMEYDDEGLITSSADRYGKPNEWTRAGAIVRAVGDMKIPPWSAAVIAMLAALPPRTVVYLRWH